MDSHADVVVVGGSFAGLTFAKAAADNGLDVVVLEKDPEIGRTIRTTGALLEEVAREYGIPERYLLNRVERAYLYSPSMKRLEFTSGGRPCFMSDTRGLIRWLAKGAESAGARILPASTFLSFGKADGKLSVTYRDAGGQSSESTIACRFIVGADGAASPVARASGLSANNSLMEGTEFIYTGVRPVPDAFHLFLQNDLAPGYFAWVVPHGKGAAVGAAGYLGRFRADDAVKRAIEHAAPLFDFSGGKIIEKKAGLIPVNPPLRRTHTGHCLLLGDAAGLCGNFGLDGILPAMVSGTLAGERVADYLLRNRSGALRSYQREWRTHDGIGRWLAYQGLMRKASRVVNSNEHYERFFSLLNSQHGRSICDLMFGTPISSAERVMMRFMWRIMLPTFMRSLIRRLNPFR